MGSSSRLRDLISEHGAVILDGGLGTELEARGVKLQGDPLWSARLLHSDPQALKDVHNSFLLAGADIISTATYQASIPGFVKHLSVKSEDARELLMSGVHVAKDTVKTSDSGKRCALVAGSVGPYGAFLHDGSEYTGAYAENMSIEDLKDWHRPQVECLSDAGADLIAFETIPSIKEAQAVVELLREFPNSEFWLSFSCKDTSSISDGSSFTDAVKMACRSTQLLAVGVNCCAPAVVEPLLDSAQSLLPPEIKWVVYPNSSDGWNIQQGWLKSGSSSAWIHEFSRTWLKQGAALMGGCCCVSPTDITELRRHLKGVSTCPSSEDR